MQQRQQQRDIDSSKPTPITYLEPVFFVESARDDASLEQNDDALERAIGDFVIEIILPILELRLLQRLHVEIGTFNPFFKGPSLRNFQFGCFEDRFLTKVKENWLKNE